MYSVKMRANQENVHISGAETICHEHEIPKVLREFFDKGFQHDNGAVDFLNLKVEKITTSLYPLEALPIIEETSPSLTTLCLEQGISEEALNKGLSYIFDDTRYTGAVILSAQSGERLDCSGTKGIRVTHFCFEDRSDKPLTHSRIQDALTIATCVNAFEHVKGELCVSDDLYYTTGYFASAQGYHRIQKMKPSGTRDGGRVIFVDSDIAMNDYLAFLQQQPKQVIRISGMP
ncbi:6-carboxyhexanoate--CoA ligase [Staphylococcus lutrae]|uniref:6-carboxyhexanoate--CoA ligase n=1 Tax=Staphylococcus lutrae TaxID=155085 RepID=A0AAC9RP15_9STAP|nr:6-carboxyhexanoate--CoA ligase [Staphylococcus lutrae]ARJ50796.1 6-carboxyhexanoate--CoA ligase [Staphylococcus lutrae]PNZ34007.1 6-carboxyhexanoate--CoA ligase [Staphylococcus lutrae]